MPQSELDVINSMLVQIGESALNEIDLNHPDVRSARTIIDDVNREIQSKEWWYNIETWELEPQENGDVVLPGNTTAILTDNINWLKRGRKLYDKENHTFDFSEEETVTIDIMSEWDLAELPPTMYTFISTTCKKRMQVGFDFNANKVADLDRDIQTAWHLCQVQNLKFTSPSTLTVGAAQTLLQKQPQR